MLRQASLSWGHSRRRRRTESGGCYLVSAASTSKPKRRRCQPHGSGAQSTPCPRPRRGCEHGALLKTRGSRMKRQGHVPFSFVCLVAMLEFVASCSPTTIRSVHMQSPGAAATSTSFRKLIAPAANARQLKPKDFATGSQLLHAQEPRFPALPQGAVVPDSLAFVALLAVDMHGHVYRASVLTSNYRGRFLGAFVGSIRSCVKKWIFNPLVIYEHHKGAKSYPVVVERAFPFSARFQFTFNTITRKDATFNYPSKGSP